MRYDALLRERLHSKGSLRNTLLGPSPQAIVVLGAARVAGTAAVLQGWPSSAEGFWWPCGSYGTHANPALCPSKCKFIGCQPGSVWCRSGCCQVPIRQPGGWLSCGDGHLRSVVPVPGRAWVHSWELHSTGWSCRTWSAADGALDLIRHIKEKHLCLKGSL